MSLAEAVQRLSSLVVRFKQVSTVLVPEKLVQELARLELEASAHNLWSNPVNAQRVTSDLSRKRAQLEKVSDIQLRITDAQVLMELAAQEEDFVSVEEANVELDNLETQISELEVVTLLAGEYDSRSAIMSIRSGAGGDDATDFAEILMRMYLRYAEVSGFKPTVLEVSHAEGAGIKSASIKFEAHYAFGKLSVESGTHRLVRMSPFNAAGKRQTSFAAVEVVPLIETSDSLEIPDTEIRVDVFRSSGPGGQSVNTTDSAVRITHMPTGVVVSCQNEKSQLQNKLEAMRVLQSRLLEMRRQEEESKKKLLTGDVKASWGEQMRSYVLAPYQMVKDLRTLHEENNPDDVFSGKLEGFISAGIRWRAQQNR